MKAVTCISWVPRGIAKSNPDKLTLTDKDLADLMKNMSTGGDSSDEDESGHDKKTQRPKDTSSGRKRKLSNSVPDSDAKIGENDDGEADDNFSDCSDDENPLSLGGLACYSSNVDDPYLKKDTDSDDDDNEILPTDNLVAVGKVNKDFCNLEVYVYNEEENNCWCHHDYILPTIPLCVEWMKFDPGEQKPGNFVAVGTMGPDIELWDLDVLESVEAAFVLKGAVSKPGKKKKRTKKGHSDAVLDLSWNNNQINALASASADFTLGLWDLEGGCMVTSFPHNEKVQSIQWQPSELHSILSGSADKRVRLFDCRTMDPGVKKWGFDGEVENVKWDIAKDFNFFISTDKGKVYYMDCRAKVPIFQVMAHEESVTGICQSSTVNGLMVTTGADKFVKVWDIRSSEPEQIYCKDLGLGQLFCVSACPDSSLIFGVGGENELRILNFNKLANVQEHFNNEANASANCTETNATAEVTIGYSDTDEEEEEQEEKPKKKSKKKKKKARSMEAKQV